MCYNNYNYEATRVLQTINLKEDGTQIEKQRIRRKKLLFLHR